MLFVTLTKLIFECRIDVYVLQVPKSSAASIGCAGDRFLVSIAVKAKLGDSQCRSNPGNGKIGTDGTSERQIAESRSGPGSARQCAVVDGYVYR